MPPRYPECEPDPDPEPLPDPVDEALIESFPASDPPAWAAVRTVRELPDDPLRPTTLRRLIQRRSDMARNLPQPFRFGDDSGFVAGPFMILQREMNRLLDEVARGGAPQVGGERGAVVPPRINVRETENAFEISVELPGVNDEDVEVDLADDLLTIRAEKREEREVERADAHLTERVFGVYQRTIRLPVAADPQMVTARMENGVLYITVPKSQAQSRSNRIQVAGRGEGVSRAQGRGDGNGGGAQQPGSQPSGGEGASTQSH